MKQDNSSPMRLQALADELYFPLLDMERSLTKKMKAEIRRISKKVKNRSTLQIKLFHETAEVKTPVIKLLATTNKPGANGAQPLRSFKTADDLFNPEYYFCYPEEVIKLVGDDLQVIKLMNEASQSIQAAQRKLRKMFKGL